MTTASPITYSVRDLQRHVSRALRSVRAGRRIVVTSRGRPVAILAPPGDETPQPGDAEARRLRDLAERGLIAQVGERGAFRCRTIRAGRGIVADFLDHRR